MIPPGMPPGSDVGNMSILGYDPAAHHTGRAPIEAAALGLRLAPDQVAYRCNLVTVGRRGRRDDARLRRRPPVHRGGAEVDRAPSTRSSAARISFHPGVQYRHIMVAPAELAEAECAPPHDLSDKAAVWPTGPAAGRLAT